MNEHNDRPLVYDRLTRTLEVSDRVARRRARLLQSAHRALAPLGYLGISRVFAFINRLVPVSVRETEIREGAFRFRFPADDYYWNRLLDADYHYEPEIDRFLQALQDCEYRFVDLGANFGYWSARVAAGVYGRRCLVAVEASTVCFNGLCRNLEAYGAEASAFRYAVADRSGAEVRLFGRRHAGFSIDPQWGGASSAVADLVVTTTLDDVLWEAGVDPSTMPVVVKLDVEGVEKQVLEGAPATVTGPSVFLIEDAVGPGRVSDAVQHAHEHLGMWIYSIDKLPPQRLNDLEDVLKMKRRQSGIQHTGLNIVATASPSWQKVLEGLSAPRAAP